jgi:predicted RecB family nuclease
MEKPRVSASRRRGRNPFKLREFRGVNPAHIEHLEARGIKTAEQLLAAGGTRAQRAALSRDTGIPTAALTELVKLSDLARLPGVKGIRARLYYAAGIDTVEKLAGWDPEALRRKVTAYVERTGFDGIPPLPKEVSSTVANARRLPKALEP